MGSMDGLADKVIGDDLRNLDTELRGVVDKPNPKQSD